MRLLSCFVIALLLAGCTRGEAPEASPTKASEPRIPTVPVEPIIVDPSHPHDYWEGRERIVLAEGRFGLSPMALATDERAVGVSLPVLPGVRVFEGAKSVEILLSNPERRLCFPIWVNAHQACFESPSGSIPDPQGGPAGVRVLVMRDGSATWEDVGEVAWGSPLTFVIEDPSWVDMPHVSDSSWRFRVLSKDVAQATLTFTAKVEQVRGEGEIPAWPGHPNFFEDGHERILVDKDVTYKEDGVEALADLAQPPRPLVEPEGLVSFGTRSLFVFANISSARSDNPAATLEWSLLVRNASGKLKAIQPLPTATASAVAFAFSVENDSMDSPYSEASRWGFQLQGTEVTSMPGPLGDSSCSGCFPYEVSFHLKIVASDEPFVES